MKKIFKFVCALLMFFYTFASSPMFAESIQIDENSINNDIKIQDKVSNIGLKLLNANKIDVRMIFVYNNTYNKLDFEPSLRKRQIVAYDKYIQFASDDAEIAAFLAREICKTTESYNGIFKGLVTSIQVKSAPKKYEIFFDKRAVDYLVTAGYNPIALITYINKAYPQKRYDKISRSNLTSKRLAIIYEYIYTKYPYYLKNNEYFTSESYQNFLLTSSSNRKKLMEKIKSGSKKAVDYE